VDGTHTCVHTRRLGTAPYGCTVVTVAAATCGIENLADRLREHTHQLHRQAERTGVVGRLLRGEATRRDYTRYLRNLLPAYQSLERGLELHRHAPALCELAAPEIYRSDALAADLRALEGSRWQERLTVLPAGEEYRARIDEILVKDPRLLVAHAYTRFLGDLNGGHILKGLLRRTLGLPDEGLNFYAFPAVEPRRLGYRAAIDRAGRSLGPGELESMLDEARKAFRFNVALSRSVDEAGRRGR
jgi:heme oxygenase